MRWRPFTWLLLSVFCFVAAVYFWRLGDQWAARKGPTPPPTNQLKPKVPSPQPQSHSQAASMVLLSQGTLNALPGGHQSPTTNHQSLQYRLSNTTRTIGQLARNDRAILLENALLDTEQTATPSIPAHLRAQGEPGAYIVQSRAPLDGTFRALLQTVGAGIVSYIPNNAYLVRASAAAAQQLAASPQTQTVIPYEPYYKLKSSLLKLAVEQGALPDGTVLNVLLFADARDATVGELQKLGSTILGEERSPFGPVLKVQPPADSLPALAGLPGVQLIESSQPRALANDLSRTVVGVSSDTITTTNYLGLSGANILIAVNDSGVDATHPDLVPRVLGDSPLSLIDSNGHGTHVAGIIAGTGLQSSTLTNVSGSIMPGTNSQFRGMAPNARLFSLPADSTFGALVSDTYLQEAAARTNAFISNNSWNYSGADAQTYDLAAASYDAAVRDALPRVRGSQPVLFVFSAGNNGGGDDNGTVGNPDSIQSPATAKNVITVGAIEQPRQITNAVVFPPCTMTNINGTNFTICQTNTPWFEMTDSDDQVAGFSSRGNVGIGIEGDFGRFKPDVVAPGTFVVSTRSKTWDEMSYYTSHRTQVALNLTLDTNALFSNVIFVPANAVQMTIQVATNALSPVPFPGLPIYVKRSDFPTPTSFDFVGTNQLVISGGSLNPLDATWFYAVGNSSTQTVTFNLRTDVQFTNDNGNFIEVLSNLNNSIGTAPYYYRYESGTSMSAADVSGVLALMQEFFERPPLGLTIHSPALMKALLINGARSAGNLYDLSVTNAMNFQGWGLINLTNSLPGGLLTPNPPTNSMYFFDQSPAGALATGQSHTRFLQVASGAAQNQPLRITLVWTDPPGNPAASIKLVNDLDLIVTNLDTGDVFFGNDIAGGNDFTLPWDTNSAPNIDSVNNVENVYLEPILDVNYSVTVVGRRVNVNAVTAHTNNVAQDYALVISCGNGRTTNALTLSPDTGIVTNNPPQVTIVTNNIPLVPGNGMIGGILLHQHVGANPPLLGTNLVPLPNDADAVLTEGVTNQWHFYVITNDLGFTNGNFHTFAPVNLALPRMGAREGEEGNNPTRAEADIDLYVSRDPALTNLDPAAITGAFKSLGRGGTEDVLFSNAVQGAYFIGIKSEDHQAAEYGFAAFFSELPVGNTDTNGQRLQIVYVPQGIPDGTQQHPSSITIFGFSPEPGMTVHRVVVTNIISHQDMGDLFGTLSHAGDKLFDVLINHSPDSAVTNRTFIYDDSSEGNIPGAQPSDGPGSLHDFAGKKTGSQWYFTMEDNAGGGMGIVSNLVLYLERQQDLTNGIIANILPGACREDFIDVPADATNLTVIVGLLSGAGPLTFEVCPVGAAAANCKSDVITGAGDVITIDQTDVPPLIGGQYVVRICNLGSGTVKVSILATLGFSRRPPVFSTFTTNGPIPILDDAVTTVPIFVTNHMIISSLDVGVLITNARASDLALTLISPNGTRVLLFEDRGGTSANGIGTFSINPSGATTVGFGYTNMTPFFTNDFEAAAVGVYAPFAVFQGWNVLSNFVAVVPDLAELCLSNNVLVLGDGIVSNTLPTTNSSAYHLTFKVTHAPYLVGMVGWWPLDMDGTDIFGGHDGLLCGDVDFSFGEVGEAFYGDGFFTSVKVPKCPDLDVGRQRGFSVEGWVYPANVTNAAPLVEWNDVTNSTPLGAQFWLAMTNGPGSLSAVIWDTNSQPHVIETGPLVLTNAGWQHVALTYDNTTLTARIYTNGNLVVAQAVSGASFVPRTSGDLYFGFHPAPTPAGTACFQGGLDEFGLYERPLSDCEVAAIFSVTNRGKYGTNVLFCPVTTTVQVLQTTLGNLSFTFTNGLAWATNGLQWETNVIDFAIALKAATNNGPATNLTPIIVGPFDSTPDNLNIAVDDFVLSALLTNNLDGLLHFTEDTNLALVPIKFAPAPYVLTNLPPTLVFSNGFENAVQGVYPIGGTLIGSSNNLAVGRRNWTVTTGPLTVVTNAERDVAGSNWLALARSAVQCELPTVPGRRYQLSYTLRGPCAAGWWNGDLEPLSQRARDLIGGNHGAFINGATNSFAGLVGNRNALELAGMIDFTNNLATKIELGDPANLRFTNSFTIEGWIRPLTQTNDYINSLLGAGAEESVIEQIFFRGDSRHCLDPYYLALEQSASDEFALLFHVEDANSRDCGITLEVENSVSVDQWQHVAAVFESNVQWTNNPPWPTNELRLYVNGQLLTNLLQHPYEGSQVDGFTDRRPFRDLDSAFSPGVSIGNRSGSEGMGQASSLTDPAASSRAEASEPFRGFIDDLTVYSRALTGPEIAAISSAGPAGKADLSVPPAQSLAKLSVSLDGVQKDVVSGDNAEWGAHTLAFTALRTNTLLNLQSLLPGTLVDAVELTEIPAELTYLPEESLQALTGEDAFGLWKLEIWDTRTGALATPAQLGSFELNFQLLPSSPPPIIYISHGIPYVNRIAANTVQHFVVQVPQWATYATNVLQFAVDRAGNPLSVGVLYDPTNFPASIANALFWPPVTSGTDILTTNGAPPLFIGQPYFLTVTNPNAVAVTFALGVWFDLTSLTNCLLATNFVGPAGIPRYFQFDVPTNDVPPGLPPQTATFWLSGAQSNLTVVLSQHLPLPDLAHYDYISAQPCTNDEIVMVVTNTTPFPIQTNRWYVGVFNSAATNVPFSVQACNLTNYPALIPLTNNVPYVASLTDPFVAPPGPPRFFFFEFQITNFVDAVLFELYGLSGDADLVLQRDLPPAMAPYFDGSFNLGTTPEQIVVRLSYGLPDLRGNWYLGVYNNEVTNVAYTIRAVVPNANGLLVSAQPILLTLSPLPPPQGFLLQWNAVVGETYQVQFSTRLGPPWTVVGTVVATTTCATFEVSNLGFYRIVQVPGLPQARPVLTIQLGNPPCAGSQLRLSWPTAFPGFTLQYAFSPVGPWFDANLPVTIVGNDFVVCDTIGAPARFYRLFK